MVKVYESVAEAAVAVGTSPQIVSKWISAKKLPAERIRKPGRGKQTDWRIKHDDLIREAQRMGFETQPRQMGLESAVGANATVADPLSLNVVWPERGVVEPFSFDLMKGYTTFRAATYTPSIAAIAKILELAEWDNFEVLFGDERLVGETDAAEVVKIQSAIEMAKTQTFVGVAFNDDRKAAIADRVAAGRVRLLTMSGGISHNKIYLLEGERGRRALSGSANLSLRGLSGRQAEALFAYDDNDFIWDALSAIWEGLAARAPMPMEIHDFGEEPALARVVDVGDLPAVRQSEREGRPVDIYTAAPADYAGSVTGLTANLKMIERQFGAAVSQNLKGGGGKVVKMAPTAVKAMRRDATRFQTDPEATEWPRLDRTRDGVFVFGNRLIKRPEDTDGIESDAWFIRQFFEGFKNFGANAAAMQRVYFAVMGWLYFSPFMSALKTELRKLGGGEYTNCQMLGIVYGDSNCGKTSLIQFLMESMRGNHPALGNKEFTPTKVENLQEKAGLYPLFYDDVAAGRFAGRSDPAGDAIAKDYDKISSRLLSYPTCIVSLNTEARHFTDAVRKRAAFFFASSALPLSDVGLNEKTAAQMRAVKNRIGQDFYAEYLHRMSERIDALTEEEDVVNFDYMRESTALIRALIQESLPEGETLPMWAREPLTRHAVFQQHMDEVRATIANRLRKDYMAKEEPPDVNCWLERRTDGQLIIGVEDARSALAENIYPDEIVLRQFSQGNVLTLDSAALVAFMRRGGADFADWSIPEAGLIATIKRAMGRRWE